MEMPEFEQRIKRALLFKANEIQPADETFGKILAGLEKKKHSSFTLSCKYCLIALICAVSLLAGTILLIPLELKSSAQESIDSAKTVFTLEYSQASEKMGNEVLNHSAKDTKPGNAGTARKPGLNVLFLPTIMNQVPDLELYLRLLLIGKLTFGQPLFENRFGQRSFLFRKVLAYR